MGNTSTWKDVKVTLFGEELTGIKGIEYVQPDLLNQHKVVKVNEYEIDLTFQQVENICRYVKFAPSNYTKKIRVPRKRKKRIKNDFEKLYGHRPKGVQAVILSSHVIY